MIGTRHAISIAARKTPRSVWDWMFGTAHLPANQRATSYGMRSRFPKHYVAQTLYAFRPLRWRARSGAVSPVNLTVDSDRAPASDF